MFRLLILLLLDALTARPLVAQNLLYVENKGQMTLVRAARGPQPMIEAGGKLVTASGTKCLLQPYDEYLPAFIAVRDVQVNTSYVMMGSSDINNEFHFRATLETPYDLENVFVLLELDMESAGKLLFVYEVGRLKAHSTRDVSVHVPLTGGGLGNGHYLFHLFSNGLEVLQSEIPGMHRENVLDHMVRKRIAGLPDAPPKLFAGPVPEYPPALRKSRVGGEAVIQALIDTNGRVRDPRIESASAPVFGEKALDAVRLWRFLPRIKNGAPMECTVSIPVDFPPPPAS